MDLKCDIPKRSLLVAGNVNLSEYDATKKVKPYVLYEYSKCSQIKQFHIEMLTKQFNELTDEQKKTPYGQYLSFRLNEVLEMSPEEHFESITNGLKYDKTTGNALSDSNPKGKYLKLIEPNVDSAMPLHNNSFVCEVKDIVNYKPSTQIIDKYKEQWHNALLSDNKESYLNMYNNEQTFLDCMVEPLFYNAFVSEETGWVEQCDENQVQWVINFRKRFINNLPLNTKLQVYNYY